MKKSTTLLLFILFVSINLAVFLVTHKNGSERKKLVLKADLNTLQTHYKVLLQTQKNIAASMYRETIYRQRVLEIIDEAFLASKERRNLLRDELHGMLEHLYDSGKINGVLQYQFVFKDNVSFLRMHKPSKFGDDLTEIRYDFRYVNETQKPTRGFVQGRVAHGFRNTFPLFNKDHKHIGAVEISFSSERFQWFLNHISNIHTHFLVKKSVFDVKFWERDDSFIKYIQSAESRDYMVALDGIYSKKLCIDENMREFKPIRDELDSKIAKGDKFSIYVKDEYHESHGDILSFLPIKSLQSKKTVAWIVSYQGSEFIKTTEKNMFVIRVITLLFSLILIYFIAQLIRSRMLLKERNIKLEDIALYDPLTGLKNRFYLESDIKKVIDNYQLNHAPYAVLMFDIDWFKEVNDTYGHDVGDVVLKELSAILKLSVREEDKVYRVGGEEFVLLLNRIAYKDTIALAEKIRRLIEQHIFKVADKEFSKTISCGLFHSSMMQINDVKYVLKLVDNALYESKTDGRNRVTNVVKTDE
jgi:diguanylate cyclase (GGDEF)-like protein